MFVVLSSTFAVIGSIKLVVGVIDNFGLIFSCKLAIRTEQIWLIHRPLLDGMLFLVAVVMAVSSPSEGIK